MVMHRTHRDFPASSSTTTRIGWLARPVTSRPSPGRCGDQGVSWDWRTAGRLEGTAGASLLEGYTQGDGKHRHTYKSIKGDFAYAENVKPTYAWFNGVVDYTTIDTKFDDSRPLIINRPRGSSTTDARIWPFKRMHTVQPYDKGNKTLVYMHLWGDDPDAFWGNYDFQRAITRGMAEDQHSLQWRV